MVIRWSWLGDHLALDIANTVRLHRGHYVDLLATPADLMEWSSFQTGRLPGTWTQDVGNDGLVRLRAYRDQLLELLRAAAANQPLPEQSVTVVNRAAQVAPTLRQLDCTGTLTTRLLNDRDPLDGLIGLTADAAISLLSSADRERLALCPAPSCGQLYLRERTNQQWCSTSCGNRARGARHHARHISRPSSPHPGSL